MLERCVNDLVYEGWLLRRPTNTASHLLGGTGRVRRRVAKTSRIIQREPSLGHVRHHLLSPDLRQRLRQEHLSLRLRGQEGVDRLHGLCGLPHYNTLLSEDEAGDGVAAVHNFCDIREGGVCGKSLDHVGVAGGVHVELDGRDEGGGDKLEIVLSKSEARLVG